LREGAFFLQRLKRCRHGAGLGDIGADVGIERAAFAGVFAMLQGVPVAVRGAAATTPGGMRTRFFIRWPLCKKSKNVNSIPPQVFDGACFSPYDEAEKKLFAMRLARMESASMTRAASHRTRRSRGERSWKSRQRATNDASPM
jgi:hypothetical protein